MHNFTSYSSYYPVSCRINSSIVSRVSSGCVALLGRALSARLRVRSIREHLSVRRSESLVPMKTYCQQILLKMAVSVLGQEHHSLSCRWILDCQRIANGHLVIDLGVQYDPMCCHCTHQKSRLNSRLLNGRSLSTRTIVALGALIGVTIWLTSGLKVVVVVRWRL